MARTAASSSPNGLLLNTHRSPGPKGYGTTNVDGLTIRNMVALGRCEGLPPVNDTNRPFDFPRRAMSSISGTVEPLRVSPQEAVAYLVELFLHEPLGYNISHVRLHGGSQR